MHLFIYSLSNIVISITIILALSEITLDLSKVRFWFARPADIAKKNFKHRLCVHDSIRYLLLFLNYNEVYRSVQFEQQPKILGIPSSLFQRSFSESTELYLPISQNYRSWALTSFLEKRSQDQTLRARIPHTH